MLEMVKVRQIDGFNYVEVKDHQDIVFKKQQRIDALEKLLEGRPTHWSNILYDKNKEIDELEKKLAEFLKGDEINSYEEEEDYIKIIQRQGYSIQRQGYRIVELEKKLAEAVEIIETAKEVGTTRYLSEPISIFLKSLEEKEGVGDDH